MYIIYIYYFRQALRFAHKILMISDLIAAETRVVWWLTDLFLVLRAKTALYRL